MKESVFPLGVIMNPVMTTKYAWSCFFLCLILIFSSEPSWSQDTAKPALRVGMELNYPPFEMTDTQGAPAGVSVDLANELGKALGQKVEIQNLPFEGLIPALKTGRIDLVISSVTITPERAKSIDFSIPYCRSGLALLLSSTTKAKTATDLDNAGMVVAVKLGTTGDVYAKNHLQKATVLELQQANACALEVVQGKADAFIFDQLSLIKYHDKFPTQTSINLQALDEEPWGIGIAKGNDDLKQRVNAFLKDFIASGGFTKLREKYLQKEQDQFKSMGVPFYF